MSRYLWGHLVAMALVVVLMALGVRYGLDVYTHHGEAIAIPNVKHKSFADAEHLLTEAGLKVVVSDTGYVKTLPPDCILEQMPLAGEKVKSGRVVYLTVNASHSPTITLPDVIDNSSLREAMAKLSAMGFKLGMPKYIPGEKDWVYGIQVKGRNVATGDKISIEDTLIILVGNGMRSASDSVDYIDPVFEESSEEGDVDEFEEVEVPAEPSSPAPSAPSIPDSKPENVPQ